MSTLSVFGLYDPNKPERVYCVCGHTEPSDRQVWAAMRCPSCQREHDRLYDKNGYVKVKREPGP